MNSSRRNIITVVLMGWAVSCIGQNPDSTQYRRPGTTSGNPQKYTQTDPGVKAPFVQQMMETSQAAKAMAQLALKRTASDQVKAYARNMIQTHEEMIKELESLEARRPGSRSSTMSGNAAPGNVDYRTDTTGSESGLGTVASPAVGSRMGRTDYKGDPAPGMNSSSYEDYSQLAEKYQVSMNRMKDLTGAEFDQEYLAAQINIHRQSIDQFEAQAATLQDAPVTQYARKHLPVLRKHLREAIRIQKQ